jgi:hypothetical protein
VLLRAGFFAFVAFAFVLLLAALLVFFLVVLALGRFFDLAVLSLLVARAFVREDRVFAMWPR